MIKAVGIDLDGTLLTDDKKVCRRNIEILQKAKEKGVKIVLCSGRAPSGMQRELKALSLKEKGQYGVGLNGGVIYECDSSRIIHRSLMKPDAARKLIQLGREMSDLANVQLYTGEEVYVERWNETTDFYQKSTGSEPKLVKDLTEHVDETVKIVFFSMGEIDYSLHTINHLKALMLPHVPEGTQCAISAPYLLEFFDESIDKGKGMHRLAEHLQIKTEEVMCIGDQENDLPMLRYAGVSVVMENGAPQVKEAADYVTQADNNEGGVAEAVEKYVLSDK